MADLSKMSNQELFKIAGVQPQNDLSSMSNEALFKAAGIEPTEKNLGLNTMAKKILPTMFTGAEPLPGERTLLGNVFERPAAAIREGIRGNGYAKGANFPEQSETFQSEWIRKAQNALGGPSQSVAVNFMKGLPASVAGFVADTLTNPADTALSLVTGGAFGDAKNISKVTKEVGKTTKIPLRKAIRPSVSGQQTAQQFDKYDKSAAMALDTIIDNKANLKFVDEAGEEIAGKLPKNLDQFNQAISQTKKDIFKAYDSLKRQAGEDMGIVFTDDIADEVLKGVARPEVQDFSPQTAFYAKEISDRLKKRGFYSVDEAQDVIQHLNSKLEAFYKSPDPNMLGSKVVDQAIANHLRKKLDTVIERETSGAYKNLKQRYGALSAIEKDVSKRAVVNARKNPLGLLDFTDVFNAQQIADGILNQNPASIVKGTTGYAVKKFIKSANDPDNIIKNTFNKVDQIKRVGVIPKGLVAVDTGRIIQRGNEARPIPRKSDLIKK